MHDHRQLDPTAYATATSHFEQEECRLLLRAQNQQQRALVAALQLVRRDLPKLARHIDVPCRKREHGAALADQDGDIADGLGRRRMRLPRLDAEHVARKVKGADLATTVAEYRPYGISGRASQLLRTRGALFLRDVGINRGES
jgi:hypothetical protein